MSTLISLPKNSPVITTAFAPLAAIEQFDRSLGRKAFKARYGEQAPPYNPARRIKKWFDTTNFTGQDWTTYLYYDASLTDFAPLVMSVEEAATVNLPGAYQYPAYVQPPTAATYTFAGVVKPLPLEDLCSREDADDLAAELGAVGVSEGAYNPASQFTIQWNEETRRNWLIAMGDGGHLSASLLVREKNRFGVGAPVEWNPATETFDQKFPDLGLSDHRPEVPMPVRALFENEALRSEIFSPLIVRTDMPSPFNK